MTPIPDSLRPLLERALEEMEADWHRIDEEFGPVEGGLDGAISRGEAWVIPELRALLSQPAEQLPPLIQCLRENGQQIAERAFDAQEAKYPQPQPSAAQVPEGYTLERDLMGAMHIKWGDFDFIQIQYQWPYTDNASTRRLAERIVELLSAPAHPAPRNEQAESCGCPGSDTCGAFYDHNAKRMACSAMRDGACPGPRNEQAGEVQRLREALERARVNFRITLEKLDGVPSDAWSGRLDRAHQYTTQGLQGVEAALSQQADGGVKS